MLPGIIGDNMLGLARRGRPSILPAGWSVIAQRAPTFTGSRVSGKGKPVPCRFAGSHRIGRLPKVKYDA